MKVEKPLSEQIEELAEIWPGQVTIDGPDGVSEWVVFLLCSDWLRRGDRRFEGETLAEAVEQATAWARGNA